jgi:glycosyltransferase involved in cell wall biosynthesis
MNPILSIVVPAYNIAPYITECVDSILAQLTPQHELIVIDDGSKDNSLALVRQQQAAWQGDNFHVITQANEGLAGVRNHGVRVAKGDYIVWVDGDDVLKEGILAALEQAIGEHHPDVIACDFQMWHPQEMHKTRVEKLSYPALGMLRGQEAILNHFLAGRKMYVWTNVIRRAIYGRLPDPIFPPGRVFEDISTVPRLLSECDSLYYLGLPIMDYRQHPASITQSISPQWCMDFARALPVSRQYLHDRGVSDSVRRHFDLTAGHFFVGIYKSTFQLPAAAGKPLREAIRQSFIDNLFGDSASMQAALDRPDLVTMKVAGDQHMLRQLRKILSRSVLFHVRQSASRKLKMWRQARKLRRYNAALANTERS